MVLRVLFDTILSSCSQIFFFLVGIPLIVLNVFYSCCFLTIELSLLLDFFDQFDFVFFPVWPCVAWPFWPCDLAILFLWSLDLFGLVLVDLFEHVFLPVRPCVLSSLTLCSWPFSPCITWLFWPCCVLASLILCSWSFLPCFLASCTILCCLTFLNLCSWPF